MSTNVFVREKPLNIKNISILISFATKISLLHFNDKQLCKKAINICMKILYC